METRETEIKDSSGEQIERRFSGILFYIGLVLQMFGCILVAATGYLAAGIALMLLALLLERKGYGQRAAKLKGLLTALALLFGLVTLFGGAARWLMRNGGTHMMLAGALLAGFSFLMLQFIREKQAGAETDGEDVSEYAVDTKRLSDSEISEDICVSDNSDDMKDTTDATGDNDEADR